MKKQIIAVDFHCKDQKVAWLDPPTGEIRGVDVRHDSTQAVRKFYAQFPAGSMVGMEVRGNVGTVYPFPHAGKRVDCPHISR